MHESAIARSLLELAAHTYRESGLSEVTKVKVIIGKFHNVINEVLETSFDFQKHDIHGFEQAVLEIEERDVMIECRDCHRIMSLDEIDFTCPGCGNSETEIIMGNELHLEYIEGTEKTLK